MIAFAMANLLLRTYVICFLLAFHSKCIDVWLTKNRKTCPLCNETVNPSRRRKSRADSEPDRASERRPLLMPVSNDINSEPGRK